MGLIDCMSPNPIGLAKTPKGYDEEFVVAPIRTFINNLELIDNVILNNLANQNKAPYELFKKRAKNIGLLDGTSNIQSTTKHSKHSAIGQFQSHNRNQFHSNFDKHSQLSLNRKINTTSQAAKFNPHNLSKSNSNIENEPQTRNKRV